MHSNRDSVRATANGDLGGGESILIPYGQQLANVVTDFQGSWYSDLYGSDADRAVVGDRGAHPVTASELENTGKNLYSLWFTT